MSASRSRRCSPTTPIFAEDAAELVALDIEPLPAIVARDRAPGDFERELTTEPDIVRKGYGDVDAAFRNAHAVVALELSVGRHSGVPLETRGAIARYDEARDMLELHGAAKVPHWNRDTIAQMLGRKTDIRSASTKAMSAAGSVFAAKFIPKMFWSARLR